jgi:3-methyladenine DNA glycosylase Tag
MNHLTDSFLLFTLACLAIGGAGLVWAAVLYATLRAAGIVG